MKTVVASAALSACVGLAAAGCASTPDPVVCTAIAVSSFTITVRDAATGQAICDARVTATQQGTVHELRVLPSDGGCTYSGPEERAGLFDVQATRSGYEAAHVADVRVTADECHVIPVRLTLDLRPSAASAAAGRR